MGHLVSASVITSSSSSWPFVPPYIIESANVSVKTTFVGILSGIVLKDQFRKT